MTSHLKFKSLELVKRDGPHPVLMVGNYTTNTRPRLSTLKTKFKEIEAAIPGMFDKIQNPSAASVSDEDCELFFVVFPLNPVGVLVEINDQTALCRVFMEIKENNKHNNFRGEYSFIDQAMYDELERVGDFKADVIKKQNTIATTSAFAGSDMTEALLGNDLAYFYEFSNATIGALAATRDLEAKIISDEAEWMTMDKLCIQGTRVGYTYAAWNPCLGDSGIVKIGATMRDSPYPRLKELSRSTPQDYCLLASIPSAVPFAIEKLCHDHFHASRVWRASTHRRTEFFVVCRDDVEQYFTIINQELAASKDFFSDQ
jgi:hypothetical protein